MRKRESEEWSLSDVVVVMAMWGACSIGAYIFVVDGDTLLCRYSITVFSTKVVTSNLETAAIIPCHVDLVYADPLHEVPHARCSLIQWFYLIKAPHLLIYYLAPIVHKIERFGHLPRLVPAHLGSIDHHAVDGSHLNVIGSEDPDLSHELWVQFVVDLKWHAIEEVDHVPPTQVFRWQPRKAIIWKVYALSLQDLWYVILADVGIPGHQTFATLECLLYIVSARHDVVKYGTVLA